MRSREEAARYMREFRKRYPEKVRARDREKYVKQRAVIRERQRKYYEKNRVWLLAERNSPEKKAYWKEYRRNNPEKPRAVVRNRRARLRGVGGSHTAKDIAWQRAYQLGVCFWCPAPLGRKYHADHWIPVAKGGLNSPGNIVLACPACNKRKAAKLPQDFARSLRSLAPLARTPRPVTPDTAPPARTC